MTGYQKIILIKKLQDKGEHTMTLVGKDDAGHRVSSGIYFIKFIIGNYTEVKKFILLK